MKGDADREVAIFVEALKVKRQERDAFLERMCSGDDRLRRRLIAILAVHDRRGNFLEEPAIPPKLAALLRKIAPPGNSPSQRKVEMGFQHRRKMRKGK
jgi:hypothetical protein